MKQVLHHNSDDDNFDLVDIESLKALRAESLERRQLDKLANEVLPTEDGEFECATLPVTAPRVEELIRLEQFPDSMERAPRYDIQLPDGHLYNEVNGEDLED